MPASTHEQLQYSRQTSCRPVAKAKDTVLSRSITLAAIQAKLESASESFLGFLLLLLLLAGRVFVDPLDALLL